MKAVKRSIRGVFSILVAAVLLFGTAEALAAADSFWGPFCPGTCPPLEGGVGESCWQYCDEFPGYVGGDCLPNGDCCCFE